MEKEHCQYCEAPTDLMDSNEQPICAECAAEFEAEYMSTREEMSDREYDGLAMGFAI